jgi:predicted XRE-type DNA-binding protein
MNDIDIDIDQGTTKEEAFTAGGKSAIHDMGFADADLALHKTTIAAALNAHLEGYSTQTERAYILAVDQSLISKLEAYKLQSITVDRLLRLAARIGVVWQIEQVTTSVAKRA